MGYINYIIIIIISIVCTHSISLSAQKGQILFENVELRSSDLKDIYSEYSVFSADCSQLKKKLHNKNTSTTLRFGEMLEIEVELSPSDILAEDIIITESGANGSQRIYEDYSGICLQGHSDYGPVRLTLNDNFINGFITTQSGRYYIESYDTDDSDKDLFILVNEKNYKQEAAHSCGHDEFIDDSVTNRDTSKLRKTGLCYELDLAIALDYSMYDKHGSTENAVDHVVSNMNNVAANYELNGSQNFDDGIEFNLVEIQLSICDGCDPWTSSSSIFVFLFDFRNWSNAGGFSQPHHMGQLWTDRDFDGNFVGLADLGSDLICNDGVYHVLQDYTSSSAFLRVMAAHEIGHNFGGLHVNSTGFIMSQTLNNTDTWNSVNQSILSAEIDLQGTTCLNSCVGNNCDAPTEVEVSNISETGFDLTWQGDGSSTYDLMIWDTNDDSILHSESTTSTSLSLSPSLYEVCHNYKIELKTLCTSDTSLVQTIFFRSPVVQGCADFVLPETTNWSGETLNFQDMSINASTWLWDFGDGNLSSLQNPSHSYSQAGIYNVTLEVNNGAHTLELDSVVSILPDRTLPYTVSDGGSFDISTSDFATEGLNGTTSIWQLGAATGPLSSTDNVWKTFLNDDIGKISTESALYTPRFDFSFTDTYTLEFEHSMETQFCNGPFALKVEYSVDDGETWTRLGSYGDEAAGITNWYNRGPSSSCPISSSVFDDATGWTFNNTDIFTSYDVSFLSGNSGVIFRFLFSVSSTFSSGYAVDGSMIDNFQINASGVVAHESLGLTGENMEDHNLLSWLMEDIEATDDFIIYKSIDGIDFHQIATIDGVNNRGEYSYKDLELEHNRSFYQVHLIKENGSVLKSETIRVDSPIKSNQITIFPNPNASDILWIDTEIEYDLVQIHSIHGKKVIENFSSSQLNISSLSAGVYTVSFYKENKILDHLKLYIQ
jgi:PKD repeat protein